MYFETGADCLWGMMSPGNIVSGHVVSGAEDLIVPQGGGGEVKMGQKRIL